MKQGQFEKMYGQKWLEFSQLLDELERRHAKAAAKTQPNIAEFSQLYRKVCHFHALAKERHYSSYLVDTLGELIVRGHQHLYQRKHPLMSQFIAFFTVTFPCLLRREQKYFWWASAIFYAPALFFMLAVVVYPELVYTVMGPSQVYNFEDMYNPENRVLGSARDASTNWYMFGFYIKNNISVAFQTFASGLLWGVGSIFFLAFNGFLFGAAAGHLINVGYTETFFTFVIAHGSFELTAIVIAGAAGLRLGASLLFPQNLTRIESLKRSAHVCIQLVYGVIAMLVVAAFIEAFWSSNNFFAPWQKYLVGASLWVVVASYLTLSGRSHEPR